LDGERFNLRKLNELEVKKKYQIEITNRFVTLENLSVDVNRTWENIKESTKTSAKESLVLHELKQHKPWFDKECLGFSDYLHCFGLGLYPLHFSLLPLI
jgi:hypothetical protein